MSTDLQGGGGGRRKAGSRTRYGTSPRGRGHWGDRDGSVLGSTAVSCENTGPLETYAGLRVTGFMDE